MAKVLARRVAVGNLWIVNGVHRSADLGKGSMVMTGSTN